MCRYRSLLPGFLSLMMIVAHPAWAQTAEAVAPPGLSLEQAHAQRVHAEALKRELQTRYAAEQDACYQKFLVNDCLASAKAGYTEALLKIRAIDHAARDVERAENHRQVEAREAARAAELPQRSAEQQAQAEHYRAEEAGKRSEREQKLADKARQAEEGRCKTAAEQAARSQKQAQRAKEDAERAAKKAGEAVR